MPKGATKEVIYYKLSFYACYLIVQNGIFSISERLDHSNISTTLNMYTHLLEEAKIKTANTINNILNNIVKS